MFFKKQLGIVSLLPVLLGIFVIIGWWGNFSVLKSVCPGYSTMKINTALCFIICGITFSLFVAGVNKNGFFCHRSFFLV